jgi:hypothetical protein
VADVALADGAEHGVGDGVHQGIGVRVAVVLSGAESQPSFRPATSDERRNRARTMCGV